MHFDDAPISVAPASSPPKPVSEYGDESFVPDAFPGSFLVLTIYKKLFASTMTGLSAGMRINDGLKESVEVVGEFLLFSDKIRW